MPEIRSPLLTARLEHALRWAAARHQGQVRRGTGVPYVQHLSAVALILDRLGFDEDVVVAGLLHDVVEDTDTTLEAVADRFGARVADLVAHCSERKNDEQGRKRPWLDRKRDHIDAMAGAPVEARAVLLADKLHNLLSILVDLEEGRPVWSLFHAERSLVLWYYAEITARCGGNDPRLVVLVAECRRVLAAIEAVGEPPPSREIC